MSRECQNSDFFNALYLIFILLILIVGSSCIEIDAYSIEPIAYGKLTSISTIPEENSSFPISKQLSTDNPVNQNNSYFFLLKWGSNGTEDGQFRRPHDVAFDSQGFVYVSDRENQNVQKFTHNGTFIKQWGSEGRGNGQFRVPYSIGVDSQDNIYVVDRENSRIQKFDSDGAFIKTWGSRGKGDDQFKRPEDIVFSPYGIFVTDTGNDRILKFDSNFTLITKWGSTGTKNGQFVHPHAIDVDSKGRVYVGVLERPGVQVFDSSGRFLAKWGTEGTGNGQISVAQEHIAVDSKDQVYIVDGARNPRVQIFDPNGKFITAVGKKGSGDGQLLEPEHISIDSKGNLYVVDKGNARMQVFAPFKPDVG